MARWFRHTAATLAMAAGLATAVGAQEFAVVLARVGARTMLAEVDVSVSGFGAIRDVRPAGSLRSPTRRGKSTTCCSTRRAFSGWPPGGGW